MEAQDSTTSRRRNTHSPNANNQKDKNSSPQQATTPEPSSQQRTSAAAHRSARSSVSAYQSAKKPLVLLHEQSPRQGSTPRPSTQRFRYRITKEEFEQEVSSGEQYTLATELCAVIVSLIERNAPIALESFGILYPKVESESRNYPLQDQIVCRPETVKTIGFEKCAEVTSYHRQRFTDLQETKSLAAHVYPRLHLELQLKWSEREVARYLRGLILLLKFEVTETGYSGLFGSIGDFFALHNRQGDSRSDWFAGANVFLRPRYHQLLKVGPITVYPRPILENALEPLEAIYDAPLETLTIDLEQELRRLGYDISEYQDALGKNNKGESGDRLSIGVFQYNIQTGDKERSFLIYASDGLRHLGYDTPYQFGTELTLQLEVEKDILRWQIPSWPVRVFVLGWVLLMGNPKRSIRPGVGISAESLFEDLQSELPESPYNDSAVTVFTTPFSAIQSKQQCDKGSFQYVNLVTITKDETEFASKLSPDILSEVLSYKGLDQVSHLGRHSALHRSGFMPRLRGQ